MAIMLKYSHLEIMKYNGDIRHSSHGVGSQRICVMFKQRFGVSFHFNYFEYFFTIF